MSASQPPDDRDGEQFSSPPCFMHEIDPAYSGFMPDRLQARDVARWRKAERDRLIATRLGLPVSEREKISHRIANQLDALIPDAPSPVISLYWPFRGEPDLRHWMGHACATGWRVALPVVIAKAKPLEFREWVPNAAMELGIWNIPFPANGEIVHPNVVIAPLVGYDQAGYRLGYGGGYFDRTLAALPSKPVIIGVGYQLGAIPTIYPQWHDIPMDWIVAGYDKPRSLKIPSPT